MRDQLRILSVVMVDQIPLFLMSDFGDGVDINRASSASAEPSRCPADVTADSHDVAMTALVVC